jgi:hypothetical protein
MQARSLWKMFFPQRGYILSPGFALYHVNMNYLHKINTLFMAGFRFCGELNSAEHGQQRQYQNKHGQGAPGQD